MKGIVVPNLVYIPCTDAGSSVVLLSAAWESYPGDIFLGPGSRESSFQEYLARVMLECPLQ